MRNIVVTRIDDRLIHGQVVTAWVKQNNVNKIVIVDDALSKDALMQRLLKAAAPAKVKVEVKDVKAASDYLKQEPDAAERIMILVKVPQAIEALVSDGVVLDMVILGGMATKAGRTKFNKNIAASEEEVESMKRILEMGTPMQYQLVPDEAPVDVNKLIRS